MSPQRAISGTSPPCGMTAAKPHNLRASYFLQEVKKLDSMLWVQLQGVSGSGTAVDMSSSLAVRSWPTASGCPSPLAARPQSQPRPGAQNPSDGLCGSTGARSTVCNTECVT